MKNSTIKILIACLTLGIVLGAGGWALQKVFEGDDVRMVRKAVNLAQSYSETPIQVVNLAFNDEREVLMGVVNFRGRSDILWIQGNLIESYNDYDLGVILGDNDLILANANVALRQANLVLHGLEGWTFPGEKWYNRHIKI